MIRLSDDTRRRKPALNLDIGVKFPRGFEALVKVKPWGPKLTILSCPGLSPACSSPAQATPQPCFKVGETKRGSLPKGKYTFGHLLRPQSTPL